MVFHALNVLVNEEPRITPVARHRAIEVLALHPDREKLKAAFFGTGERSSDVYRRRLNPAMDYQIHFAKTLLRLPRSFWRTQEEKTQAIHKDWQNNPLICQIFKRSLNLPYHERRPLDYGAVFNTLVEKYPGEAVQIALLMMNDYEHGRAAFDGLLGMACLDPIKIISLFGPEASYLRMHQMPGDDSERIQESLGLHWIIELVKEKKDNQCGII